jgi:hypothetical protein
VAAETARLPSAPLDPPSHASEGIDFRSPIPWLVFADLPAGSAPLLRYDVTYDDGWTAIYAGSVLSHLRIDGAVNGWLVPERTRPTEIVLIERGAAITTFAELASAIAICWLVLYAFRTRAAARALPIAVTATSDKIT